MNPTIAALFLVFFSGTTGLIYQVTWQRYLAIFLGSNSMATSLVLGVFFLFMALEYLLLGQWTHRLMKNKILLYGVIEGLIGLYGMFSPDFFYWLSEMMTFATGSRWGDIFSNVILTSLFIGFPTFLMGGTIPILTEGLVRNFEVSHRTHAWIYSINTAGAFFGTLLAGFYLIETLGLPMTIWYASVLNLIIAFLSYILSKISRSNYEGLEVEDENDSTQLPISSRTRWALYAISFLSGYYVFSLENMIIRLTAISIGPSTYSYSMVVAAFILSLAVGSSLVSRFKTLRNVSFVFWVQSALIAATILMYLSVPYWGIAYARLRTLISPNTINFEIFWFLVTSTFMIFLLIPVGLMGMNLPLLFGFLKLRSKHLSQVVGNVYAVNCLGSFVGSIFGGYLIFFLIDGPWVIKIAIFAICLTCALLIFLAPTHRKQMVVIPIVGILISFFLPDWKTESFVPARYLISTNIGSSTLSEALQERGAAQSKVLYSRFDADAHTVVKKDEINGVSLFINGKPDAVEKGDVIVRSFNALFPMTYAPNISNVFIVGLGGSRSSGIVTSYDDVKHLDVAEMTKGVIDSRKYFDDHAYQLSQRASKYSIHHGDAYKVLMNQDKKYGVIISEPSNPWVVGVEKLFSFEFLNRAKSKLEPDGYYVQWFPLFGVDDYSVVAVLKTFQSVFPWVTAWNSAGRVLMIVAGNEPLPLNEELWKRRFHENSKFYTEIGIENHLTMLSRQLLSPLFLRGFSKSNSSVMTLENPFLSFRNGRTIFDQQGSDFMNLLDEINPYPMKEVISSSRFVYDQLVNLPLDFFTDSYNYHSKSSGFKEVLTRLRIRHAQLYKDSAPRNVLKLYSSLQGQSKISISSSRELHLWIERAYQLKRSQIPFSIQPILRGALECVSDECLGALQSLIGFANGLSQKALTTENNRWLKLNSLDDARAELKNILDKN